MIPPHRGDTFFNILSLPAYRRWQAMTGNCMFYDTNLGNHGLKYDPFKALIVPRPIGWITTISEKGKLNLAPYSFFNGISDQPPMVAFSVGGRKDTLRNIEQTKYCTCSLVTQALTNEMNLTSAAVDNGVNEFDIAKLELGKSQLVSTPRVRASPASFECQHWQTIELPKPDPDVDFRFTLVICRVLGIYINDDFIVNGLVDTASMMPIARLGYMDYSVVNADSMFTLNRPEVSEDGQSAHITNGEWDGIYR